MILKPRKQTARGSLVRRLIAGATLATFIAAPPSALAAITDISNSPISSAATTTIPPNILFILDGSGSMDSEYMPDSASGYAGNIGGKNRLCNTIYYNPNTTYVLAKNSDGTDFPAPSFTSAPNDGFPSNSPSGSSNLNTSFKPNGSSSSEPAYYYKWAPNTAGVLPNNTDCNRNDSSSFPHVDVTGNGTWTKVRIAAAEQQNFANWYTFYRTRLMMMKSSAGLAFAGLNDNFRIGFITICPDGSSCSSDTALVQVKPAYYLKIDNFTPTHKKAWYDKFYTQQASSFTPLRQALARAGRHFAGMKDGINNGMPDDPVQFSCQQNFAILTTDGYWNYGRGKQLNGSTDIGGQDQNLGLTPRPMYDGGPVSTTTVTTILQERYITRGGNPNCSGATPKKATYQTQTVTSTVTVDQQGGTTTSTSSLSTGSSNICVPNSQTLSNTWITLSTTPGTPTTASVGGTANTLADVAEYYYRTDLRPTGSLNASGVDVSKDNVPQAGTGVEDDKARNQHMTTFTLGLGLSGQLAYQEDYKTASTGDFAQIRAGQKGWPDPNPGSPNSASNAENLARIDDLWHAAVNGRGNAYSATDPVTLAVALKTALSAIQAKLSSAAAAATSSLEPTVTDRLAFTPTYVTADWTGEVEAFQINLDTGALVQPHVWSAREKLDLRTKAACDTRNIYLYSKGATSGSVTTNLVDFTLGTTKCDTGGNPTIPLADGITSTADLALLKAANLTSLTQWGLMTDGTSGTVDQRSLVGGSGLINYLRGQRGMEGFTPNDAGKLYRSRKHVLGDIVNSTPVYVRTPYFDYTDPGYAAFKSANTNRTPMVLVGSNAGTFHAFAGFDDAITGGEELWAYVPRMVLPNLYKIADTNWANLHEYSVDATATVGDVNLGTTATPDWRTVAVVGLNKGGRGYFALDVTDPNSPKALWEFTLPPGATAGSCSAPDNSSDCDIGFSYGNPVISKLEDGTWVVFVTSGLNNVSPGTGEGYLYVLDAKTGKWINKIPTGKGNTTTPSGLTKIRNWVDTNASVNNTTARVYGVDILGDVFRFDVNDKFGKGTPTSQLLATLSDGTNPQPITTRPELAEVGNVPYVYVATGRYLAANDVTDTQVQSLYAISDPLDTTTTWTNPRATFGQVLMTTTGTNRYAQCVGSNPLNCSQNGGWYADLPEKGERTNVDMKLQLGAIVVATNVPANTACEPGGTSYINAFNFKTGLAAEGSGVPVGKLFSSALAVGINIIRLPNGKVVVVGMDASGTPQVADVNPFKQGVEGKRITWREISD